MARAATKTKLRMGPLSLCLFKRIIESEVVQGSNHAERISALFGLIIGACRAEFYEDNEPTAHEYLREWFEAALSADAAAERAQLAKVLGQ